MKTIKKLILLAAVAAGVSFTAVSGDLPPGYQRVEYIQATGAQWIDTGYVPVKDKTGIDISFGQIGNNQTVFAQTFAWGDGYLFVVTNNKFYFDNNKQFSGWSSTADFHVIISPDGTVMVDYGQGMNTYAGFNNGTRDNVTLGLFGAHGTSTYPGKYRLYRLKIYHDGELVRDFLPCRKDDKPGLFDLAHAEDGDAAFYVNAATGTDFTLGDDYVGFDFKVADQFADGQASYTPAPVITDRDSGEVQYNGDFDIVYDNNTAVGVATVTVTGKAGSDYAGQQRTKSFEILPVYRVTSDVVEEGDGQTWGSPMSFAAAYATVCASGGAVWMKSGDYSLAASLAKGTLAHSVEFRGGFAGAEEHASERPDKTRSTLDGGHAYTLFSFDNAAASITVERLNLIRSSGSALVKTGKGDLSLYDCDILCNAPNGLNVHGKGINASGSSVATLTISNCVFAGNICQQYFEGYGSGAGIYVASCAHLIVDDSLFATNGCKFGGTGNFAGQAKGDAIYVSATPVTARRCRFAGNVGSFRYSGDSGGVVLEGACEGSLFENCVWSGNYDWEGRSAAAATCAGALVLRLSDEAGEVDVFSCTFGYNFAAGASPGALNVYKGTANVRNCVFFGNVATSSSVGSDIGVSASGYLKLAYSSFSGTGSVNITYPEGHAEIVEKTLYAFDPLFVTSAEEAGAVSGWRSYTKLASFDCHLLSRATYYLNDGTVGPVTDSMSPAVDKGDPEADYSNEPEPNGYRLNLGAYGNTKYASTVVAGGKPKVESLDVAFPGGVSLPCVTLVTGLASGSEYSATVTITCETNGVKVGERVFTEVVSGATLYYAPNVGLVDGDDLDVKISFVCADGTTVDDAKTVKVSGVIAPWIGKGGGATIVHVRPGAYGMNDGTSWADAFTNIVDAFDALALDIEHVKRGVWLAGDLTNTTKTLTLNAAVPFAIRGGFTGVENAPAERPTEGVASLENGQACDGLSLTVAQDTTTTVDRIRFAHGQNRAINKMGKGSLEIFDCSFEGNGRTVAGADGRGCTVAGGSVGALTVSNCVFHGNLCTADQASGSGGISASSCVRATLDNCLFVSNGCPLSTSLAFTGNNGCVGAIRASATPLTVRNCRFVGNTGTMRAGAGGAVRLEGACGGSAFTNCLWVGNADWPSRQGGASQSAALSISLDSVTSRVDLKNCTIAYNLFGAIATDAVGISSYGTGGISVNRGDVAVRDSIIFGNKKGARAAADCGTDIDVKTNSVIHLAYCLVPTLDDASAVHGCTAECLDIATNTMVTGDALFVSPTGDFDALVSGGLVIPAKSPLLASLNAHLRGGLGYRDENTGEVVRDYAKRRNGRSPAIDAGDPASGFSNEPKPNGHRVNLGFYGNTPWATMSNAGLILFVR